MPNPYTQQTIIQAFDQEVYDPSNLDVQHTPLYDTVTIPANSPVTQNVANFFTNVGAASGKSYVQTNVTQSQKLSNPESFSIFAIRFRWAENILPVDLYAILSGFVFEFYIGQKCYNRAPLWQYNAGGGVYGSVATTVAATTSTFLSNGMPGREHMHKLAIPIVIETNASFYAQLFGGPYTLNAGGTGATFQLMFDGLYARGVQ